MALAVLRGCKFAKEEEGEYLVYIVRTSSWNIFQLALEDVAKALGYQDADRYNNACEGDPREVRRRIRALAPAATADAGAG